MDISIKFLMTSPKDFWDAPALEGDISIGENKEFFYASLLTWNQANYQSQWQAGLERLNTHQESCLVTSVQQPRKNVLGLVRWWVLYKIGSVIFVQNKLFAGQIYWMIIGNDRFTPDNCYKYIPTRRTHTTDGTKISEWCINAE